MTAALDERMMRIALGLAERGLGRVAPNPAVGCVIVQPSDEGGRIVGRGWTQPFGGPTQKPKPWRVLVPQLKGPRPMSRWSLARIQARPRPAPRH